MWRIEVRERWQETYSAADGSRICMPLPADVRVSGVAAGGELGHKIGPLVAVDANGRAWAVARATIVAVGPDGAVEAAVTGPFALDSEADAPVVVGGGA